MLCGSHFRVASKHGLAQTFFSMTLASLVLVIIRGIRDIRGQILQPRMSRMTRINMGETRQFDARGTPH